VTALDPVSPSSAHSRCAYFGVSFDAFDRPCLPGKVTAITRRLMGMILVAIAMQMILTSLRRFSDTRAG
jgi:hypothetical protein